MIMNSNLSKIKPKLRTTGRVSGNFGRNKVQAGSTYTQLGMTTTKTVKCVTPDEYLSRLHDAFDTTQDVKLKQFIFIEIRNIHIKRGTW